MDLDLLLKQGKVLFILADFSFIDHFYCVALSGVLDKMTEVDSA